MDLDPIRPMDKTPTVLLVDDDPLNTALMKRILEGLPIPVTTVVASSGAAALEAARSAPPDLVVLDLHMPRMGGEAVLLGLRSDERTRAVPVIVVSGETPRGLLVGAIGLFQRPLNIEGFLSCVSGVLGLRPLDGRRD